MELRALATGKPDAKPLLAARVPECGPQLPSRVSTRSGELAKGSATASLPGQMALRTPRPWGCADAQI